MPNPQPPLDPMPTWIERGISVLNGMIGDYLHERRNGLAIAMAFYHRNRPLPLTTESLHQAHANPTAKLCILLHGLGCNEGIWTFREGAPGAGGLSYGALLQQELGYTPFYLRYNTGLPVAENGKGVAVLLDELLACYPARVTEIVLIGHSMGGLVLRSACHYGLQHPYGWIEKVRHIFYLGTPHEGADLEKLGYLTVTVLQAVPNPITRLIGSILNRRSQGVKDLQHGNLLAGEPLNNAPDAAGHAHRQVVPWLASARHYLLVGTLTAEPGHPMTLLLGDALVRLPRAHKQAHPQTGSTSVPNQYVKLFPQVHHLGLACHPEVYRQIKLWCAGEEETSDVPTVDTAD